MASLQIYDPFADPAVEPPVSNFLSPASSDRETPHTTRLHVPCTANGYDTRTDRPAAPRGGSHRSTGTAGGGGCDGCSCQSWASSFRRSECSSWMIPTQRSQFAC